MNNSKVNLYETINTVAPTSKLETHDKERSISNGWIRAAKAEY
jgi:hypothetical protein